MSKAPTYEELLAAKQPRIQLNGFDVGDDILHPQLKPFQRFCLRRALMAGRYALLEDCGLGKTFQAGVWADYIVRHTDRPIIVLAPLAVVWQTIQEYAKWGISVIEWQDGMHTLHEVPAGIYITNYENLHNLPIDDFIGVVLDESSILKNEDGATSQALIECFENTPYKLCLTATASPNDVMELGTHAEFLGVMKRSEMLAMYFKHDGGKTSEWRLKGHSRKIFWRWVNTWAIMLRKPSDIGFSDEGYILPDLDLIERCITTPKRDNGLLFNDVAISATNFNEELRITQIQRLDEVADIVNGINEQFIIWIKHDEEGRQLRKMIPGAIEVKGSDSKEYRRSKLLGFANNEFRVLISKVKIAGFGMNFQNAHNMVFASPDFSFEGIYQALRRMLRFGQLFTVRAWIVTTDTMENVIQNFYRKQKQHDEMLQEMQASMHEALEYETKDKHPYEEYKTEDVHLMRGDSIALLPEKVEDNSIGLSIWSPPFPELYVYSDDTADLGNCKNYDEFMQFFSFIPARLFPKIMPGRNVVIHCMDTPIQKGKEGYIGLRDFSGMIIEKMTATGFIYHSRITIWKDPVVEMQRTKALGLLHKQVKKDAAMSRVGIPDYLLVFRKPGTSEPVKCDIPVDLWQQYASPVWMDIDYGDTLNVREAREDKDEKHICPLQLPTIGRCIHLWTNPGDKVLTLFMGIGSEPYKALLMGRKGIGFELKPIYFKQAVKNVKAAEMMLQQGTLESMLDAGDIDRDNLFKIRDEAGNVIPEEQLNAEAGRFKEIVDKYTRKIGEDTFYIRKNGEEADL